MTAVLLDGRPVAAEILQGVAARAHALLERDIQPCLVFLSVGASESGLMYSRRLERLGTRQGIRVSRRSLPPDCSPAALEREVAAFGADKAVDGVVVQMPLPGNLRSVDLSAVMDPRIDVDGITVENAGRLALGLPARVPSTAVAMMEILHHAGIDPAGRRALVLGRSKVVGHPAAELLLRGDATVTTAHSKTPDLTFVTRQAEILFAAVGRPRLIRAEMVSPGVVIVDAGINVVGGELVGDVGFEACSEVASAITPVPGGVGPVTNAVLLRSVVESAERRQR